MDDGNTNGTAVTIAIGLDLGDRNSHLFALRTDGTVLRDKRVSTTRKALQKELGSFGEDRVRAVIEAGSQSPWVSRLIESSGHEVVVANPRAVGMVNKAKKRKNDRTDAETLAHWGLHDLYFLSPIQHRGAETQVDLTVLRSRDLVVGLRTEVINHVRSVVKLFGERLPSCDTEVFHRRAREHIPEALRSVVEPLFELLTKVTETIQGYDQKIEELSEKRYPQTELLRQIKGVGPITALAFILTLEDARRFRKSRQVGAHLGLVPGEWQTGGRSPQLRITKAGDDFLRRMLIQASHYILGPFGPDCDLRRHGERISARGGKNAKKRAVVAVARKLSVLLHHLWKTGEVYEPLYNSERAVKQKPV